MVQVRKLRHGEFIWPKAPRLAVSRPGWTWMYIYLAHCIISLAGAFLVKWLRPLSVLPFCLVAPLLQHTAKSPVLRTAACVHAGLPVTL